MGVETKMVSENARDANAMQIPRHRYYVSSGVVSSCEFEVVRALTVETQNAKNHNPKLAMQKVTTTYASKIVVF